jgi:hypothetical protein
LLIGRRIISAPKGLFTNCFTGDYTNRGLELRCSANGDCFIFNFICAPCLKKVRVIVEHILLVFVVLCGNNCLAHCID